MNAGEAAVPPRAGIREETGIALTGPLEPWARSVEAGKRVLGFAGEGASTFRPSKSKTFEIAGRREAKGRPSEIDKNETNGSIARRSRQDVEGQGPFRPARRTLRANPG